VCEERENCNVEVEVRAEADDAASLHRRRLTGDFLHHDAQPACIFAPLFVGHRARNPSTDASVRRIAGSLLVAMPSCSHSCLDLTARRTSLKIGVP
jgi:hypothetical protein